MQKRGYGVALRVEALLATETSMDLETVQGAIDSLAQDCEILRTDFVELSDGTVLQRISDSSELRVESLDLPDADAAAIWSRLRILHETSRPNWSSTVFVTGAGGRHYLYLNMSALLADRRSLWTLSRELMSRCAGLPLESTGGTLQYADIAEWKHALLETEQAEEARLFWSTQAADASAWQSLRCMRNPRTAHRFEPGRAPGGSLPAASAANLEAVSLGCWAYLCSQHLDAGQVVIGVASDSRAEMETAAAVGPMTATLPIALRIDPSETFACFCSRIADQLSSARAWQDLFQWEKLEAEHGSPLFCRQSFEYADESRDGGRSWEMRELRSDTDHYELKLVCVVRDGQATCHIDYDRAAIDDLEVSRLMTLYEGLLREALRAPDLAVAALAGRCESLTLSAYGQLNGALAARIEPALVSEMFERQVRATPDAIAVIDGEASVSFAELNRRANQMARFLLSLGLEPEEGAGILLPRSIQAFVSVLGVLKAGGAFLPLDGSPKKRLQGIVESCGLRIVIAEESAAAQFEELGVRVVSVTALAKEIERFPGFDLRPRVGGGNLAYVLFTSGSTGAPKGVMVPHEGVVNYLSWARSVYDRDGTAGSILFSALDFDFTMTAVFLPLICGRAVVVARKEAMEFVAQSLSAATELTFLKLTPAHLRSLQYLTSLHPAAAKLLVVGGEALSTGDLRWLGSAPDTLVVNEYGPTEAVVGCCTYSARIDELSRARDSDVPIGRPICNTSIALYTREGALALPGAPGEIWIGGQGLARGYVGRPALTAASFRPDGKSAQPGARVYRTGDYARLLPDNNLVFLGRIDGQVKFHGFRIELDEISQAARRFQGVTEAVAIMTGDSASDARIALLVRTEDNARFVEAELRAFLAQWLPAHMIPAVAATVDSIPLTEHGKVDRKELARRISSLESTGTPYQGPTTQTEKDLVEIWGAVLKREAVGVDDNFFTIGGDSIRSIQVLALATKRGYRLSLAEILEAPTIRRLAAKIGTSGAEPLPPPSRQPFALLSEPDRARISAGLEDAYPMACMQEGMLFHSEWDAGGATYHDIVGVHLEARYDRRALESCLREVVNTHPILRTVFDLRSFSQPVQLVLRYAGVDLDEYDLSDLSADDQESAIQEWMAREKGRRFEWSKTPPHRFYVHLRGPASFQFSICFHHALLDGWSTATLLLELLQRYLLACGLAEGELLAAPKSLYRDYVLLEQKERNSEAARTFWKTYLDQAPPTLYGRAQETSAAGVRRHERVIGGETYRRVVALGRELGVPLKTVLLAAHLKVIATLANHSEIVTGVVSNGRVDEVDGERALGLFLNTLPVRFTIVDRTWRAVIQELYDTELRCSRHRRFPVADTLRMIGTGELFDTAFNFVHYHLYAALNALRGIQVVRTYAFEETNFALLASFVESGASDRLTLLLDADAARLRADGLPAIADLYENALRALGSDPDGSALDFQLISEREEPLLRRWSQGRKPERAPAPVRVERRVLAQAKKTPDKLALVFGDAHVSYRALVARARQVAAWLARKGIGPEQVVALDLDRSLELMFICLGTLLAGAAYIYVDRKLPQERRRFILGDSNPGLIITDHDPAEYAERAESVWRLQDVVAEARESTQPPSCVGNDLESLCYLMYTSGSTGTPKGIAMPHRPLAELIGWQIDEFRDQAPARTLQYTPLSFDVSFQEIYSTWGAGGTLVLIAEDTRDRPRRMWEYLRQQEVERLFLPCAALKQLVATHAHADAPGRLGLKQVITAGDVLHLTGDLKSFFADHPLLTVTNQYGPAETHVVTACALSGSSEMWPALPSIGSPVAGANVYLLNDRLRPVPIGSVGEIYLGGDAVSRGYINRAGLTAERFLPDCHSGRYGARLYRSGDSARFYADGKIEFLGRKDHQVKVLGHRVELGEIETVIESIPEVVEAVVESGVAPDGETQLVAYVVVRAESGFSIEALRQELGRKLPRYMIPARFVTLDAMPRTVSGKIDRKSLPRTGGVEESRRPAVPPANAIEAGILEIWKRALNKDGLGVEDDFFEVGGHSLTATRIVVSLRAEFHVDLPIKAVFEMRSIRAMAMALGADISVRASFEAPAINEAPRGFSVEPVARGENLLLAPQQENWWRQEQRTGNIHPNNIYYSIRFQGGLDAMALEQSLGMLQVRHEALRTAFIPCAGGGAVPVVSPPETCRFLLTAIDLSQLAAGRREEALIRIARSSNSRPFDLTKAPLCRVLVVRLGAEDHVVLFATHHLVCDGWSIEVFAAELSKVYSWFVNGSPAVLPELSFQYVDFAHWQRNWLVSPDFAPQLAYWMRQLRPPWPELFPAAAGVAAELDMPYLIVRRRALFVISPETAAGARSLARASGCTLFSVVLAALKLVLYAHTRQPDVRIGTLVANRGIPGSEKVIGLFANVVCLRTDVPGSPTFRDLVKAVQKGVLDATAHQELPFDVLRRAFQMAPGAQPGSLVQVMAFWAPLPHGTLQFPGARASLVLPQPEEAMALGRGSLELVFNLEETPAELNGAVNWKTGRFSQRQIERFARDLELCLSRAGQEPELGVRQLCDILNPSPAGAGSLLAPDVSDHVEMPFSELPAEQVDAP